MITLKTLSQRIHAYSTGRVTAVAVLIFLFFMLVVLPRQATAAAAATGDAPSPDSSLFYTAADLYDMATAYGETGRAAYIRARFTFDVVWPLAYLFFMATSLSWLTLRLFPANSPAQHLNLLPVAGFLFDYAENLATSWAMWRFPVQTWSAYVAGGLTAVKWLFVNGSLLLVMLLGLWGAVRWVRQRRQQGKEK